MYESRMAGGWWSMDGMNELRMGPKYIHNIVKSDRQR